MGRSIIILLSILTIRSALCKSQAIDRALFEQMEGKGNGIHQETDLGGISVVVCQPHILYIREKQISVGINRTHLKSMLKSENYGIHQIKVNLKSATILKK